MRALLAPDCRGGRSAQGCARCDSRRPRSRSAAGVARVSHRLSRMSIDVAETAIVYPGTVLGEGCRILDYAVVGKQPTLGPRSTTKREELPPVELGPGTIVSTGAIVFAGSHLGARVIVGDQACVRERCDVGADVVIGRGKLVENDTTIGLL